MSVRTSGPFFDGEDIRLLHEMSAKIAQTVTDHGYDLVMTELPRVLRHPTGRLQSHVHTAYRGEAGRVISDGVVYNAWIEGVGSRNAPKTRFKGYFTFRRMCEVLRSQAASIARPVADRYVGRM